MPEAAHAHLELNYIHFSYAHLAQVEYHTSVPVPSPSAALVTSYQIVGAH